MRSYFLCTLFVYYFGAVIGDEEITSNLLPDSAICGQKVGDRIVGGTIAALDEFPWMALLEFDIKSPHRFRCGGFLINNRYVVTAGHCILPQLISVRLGEYDLNTEEDCEGDTPGLEDCADKPLDILIEEKIAHHEYDPNSSDQRNDIALLRLSKEVSFSRYIKPICLPLSSELRNKTFAGETMTVAGWGKTENLTHSHVKLKLDVPVNPNTECTIYGKYKKELSDKQICAGGDPGKDSCGGDSGGPLMFLHKTPKDEIWYAAGVVSYGPDPCGIKGWPGVYTRVTKYVEWIVKNLKP